MGKTPTPVKTVPTDVALILQSGGTTGKPRGIMLTHGALLAEALQLRAWLKPVLRNESETIMLNLPLFHVFGNAAGLCVGIVARAPMALVPDPRDHGDILNTIQKVRPVLFAGVPTLFAAIANHPAVIDKKIDFSSVRLAVSGAANLSAEVRDRFTRATGIKLIQGYGLTETSAAIIAEPVGKPGKPGTIGLPLPDVEIKIVDSDRGNKEVITGKEGEILVKCPQVMTGFWNSLEETEEMLSGGWLHTGDVGYMDKDGYIFVTARKKELIKVSGFQVWPNEIIQVLKTHPAVADACVRGIPDVTQGESVKAWVVLYPGMELRDEELRDYCRQKLTAYKVPRYIEFRKELPSALSGQKLCRILVEEEKAKTIAGV
jgi:long-chain acyl-CoA synthetase